MSREPELVDLAEQTFFEDPALDRAFGVVMALATEVYVLRNRQQALERLLEEAGILDRTALGGDPPMKNAVLVQMTGLNSHARS